MLRRALAASLIVLAVGAMIGIAVAAAPPSGPRLAVLKLAPGPAPSEIATLGPAGGGYRRVLAAAPRKGLRMDAFSTPAWSPDGSILAFSHRGQGPRMISLVPAAGGAARVVPGTKGGALPVFSPDGRSLAFGRFRRHRYYESASVWIVDLETGVQRQLTRWRDGLEQFPSSFSPDGTTLLLTRSDIERSQDPETVALRFDGRTSSLLVGEGSLPVYSPDGSKIALFRESGRRVDPRFDLFVIDADGSHLRRLTRTPGESELFASWDPSGERIAYSQVRGDPFGRKTSGAIMKINADGTCPTEILSMRKVGLLGPAWQPGPGREAGRIEC